MGIVSRSMFSVLRIEDDSDDERRPPANNTKQPSKGKGNNNASKKNGGLVVHAIERQRPKNKKNTADKAVDPVTGYVVRDPVTAKKETKNTKDSGLLADFTADDVTTTASKETSPTSILSDTAGVKADSAEDGLPALYKFRMNETVDKLNATVEELAKSHSQVEYHKNRYKKLVELFKDAELAEKAKIIMELESANETIQVLTTQLNEVNGLLEQARSRVRALEGHK